MTVNATNDWIIRQTKQRFKYQPGKSHEVLITGLFLSQSGITSRVGLLDYDNVGLGFISNTPQNGVALEVIGGVASFVIYNNGVRTERVLQSNWNIDKADGTGENQFLLDLDSTNILFFDLEWLGVGAVRCGFVNKSGEIVICHQFQHASNGFSDVYMRTANLPVSYYIGSFGGSGTLKQICSSVISEGGFNPKGVFLAVESLISGVVCSADTLETILGIRLKEDSFEYSIEIDSISILAESSGDGRWYLLFNPTLASTPTWADIPNSVLQKTESNIEVTDRNIIIAGGTYSSDNDAISAEITSALRLGKDLLGDRDEIFLAIYSYTTEIMHGFINLRQSL